MFFFEQIEERDVDFIVMRAFSQTPGFLDLFLDKTGWTGAKVVRIEHSATDPIYGESDITVLLSHEDTHKALLIENKIDAVAMLEQCLRYHKRGDIGVSQGLYSQYAVFLIAPQEYLASNAEAKKYPYQISYEALLDVFEAANNTFEAEIIRQAIAKKSSGYTVHEIPAITLFWKKLYEYSCSCGLNIEMYPATDAKGSRSNWPRFRVPLKGAELYYKSRQGVVDLQFTGKLDEGAKLKADLFELLDPDMHWENTGRSISLRIKVKPVDFREPFEQSRTEIYLMLEAIERLTAFAYRLNDSGYII